MEMTITLTEMFLGAWAAIMTLLWFGANNRRAQEARKIVLLMNAIADKQAMLIRDEDGDLSIRKGDNYVDAR